MALFLVTGASGFIGRHLTKTLLDRGHRVRCYVRRTSKSESLKKAGAEIALGDLQDSAALKEALQDVDYVIHLAAMVAAFDPKDMLTVNRDGTRSVAEACLARPTPPVLVLVSSIAAAGPAPRGGERVETDPPAPVSNYGRSKLEGEKVAVEFADRLPTTIVRPGIVFGPDNDAFFKIISFIRALRFHPVASWTPPALSLIHVDDLNDLLILAAEKGKRLTTSGGLTGPGVYFGVMKEHPDYAEFGLLLAPMLGRPWAPKWRFPGLTPVIIAKVNEMICRVRGKADELNLDKIREARVSSWACSPESVRRDLGYQPPYSLNERLKQTVDWYFREKWL